jgi:hypothetical protein
MQNFRSPFWKILNKPHVIRHTLIHPHVIRIRLVHPWEIWLVAFQIYHICKVEHILSKYMIIIDYYMAFFISHVISTGDAHIRPRDEGPRANMGRGLIWHVIWQMPYNNLFIIYFNASFFIFVRADHFQKPSSLIWDMMQ